MEPDSGNEMNMQEDPESLQKLYAKTNFALRESRKEVLKRYEVEDEAALLERIKGAQVDEHPAYDDYLGALIVEQTRQHVRADMLAQLGGIDAALADAPASLHLMLKEQIESHYGDRFSEPLRLAQNALILSFDTGLLMEVRYFSSDEYVVSWSWGEAELRIDTAPIHRECPTFPNHLHRDDGAVHADPVTQPGTDCWANFSRLLDVLLVNPLLDPETSA